MRFLVVVAFLSAGCSMNNLHTLSHVALGLNLMAQALPAVVAVAEASPPPPPVVEPEPSCDRLEQWVDPASPDPALHARAARCFEAVGNWGQAIEAWRTILRRAPEGPEARLALASMGPDTQRLGDLGEAASWYLAYATRYPAASNARGHLARGVCLFRLNGDRDREARALAIYAQRYGHAAAASVCQP